MPGQDFSEILPELINRNFELEARFHEKDDESLFNQLRHIENMAQIIEGRRHDLGDKFEFLKTTIECALKRDAFAKPLREFLKQIIREK